jgi:hypothetical protein
MTNKNKVRDWVFKEQLKKRVKGFKIEAIEKELDIPRNDIMFYCMELAKEDLLGFQILYYCDCGFVGIYETLADIPDICDWCEGKINIKKLYLDFIFIRDNNY